MTPAIYSTNKNDSFFPSIFNDFFGDNWLIPKFHGTTPAINVSETDKCYKVEVAAPGMCKEDFSISLGNDDELVISMEKKTGNNTENKKYLRREFSYSKFEQRLTLPDNVEKQNISAQMTDGVLTIDIPKMTEAEIAEETHYIEIK